MFKTININDLLTIINKINIIDIRSVQKYNSGHIPNAINIPYDNLILNPSKYINKDNTYYIYCNMGQKSVSICTYLSKLGYKTVNISGGYEKWLLK